MSYQIDIKKSLDLSSSNVLKITNIQNRKNLPKIKLDYGKKYALKTFELDGKKYNEYVREIIFSNGNYEQIHIAFIPETENIPDIIETYILSGGECPKCKESYFTFDPNMKEGFNTICKKCNHKGYSKDFFWK